MALSDTEFSAVVEAVTSAFGDPTRRQVYLYVRESATGVTASQVAERFSLHPNVARHHLDKLAAGGYVEVFCTRSAPAGAGRPSKRYRTSGPAPLLEAPRRTDDLLVALLGGALSLLPQGAAEEMAEGVGYRYGAKLASEMPPDQGRRSVRSALQVIADALTAHGFEAHAEARGRSLTLVRDACPFFDAASRNPVICAVDRGMVRGMLSVLYAQADGAGQWSSRAQGGGTCMTCLPAGA